MNNSFSLTTLAVKVNCRLLAIKIKGKSGEISKINVIGLKFNTLAAFVYLSHRNY